MNTLRIRSAGAIPPPLCHPLHHRFPAEPPNVTEESTRGRPDKIFFCLDAPQGVGAVHPVKKLSESKMATQGNWSILTKYVMNTSCTFILFLKNIYFSSLFLTFLKCAKRLISWCWVTYDHWHCPTSELVIYDHWYYSTYDQFGLTITKLSSCSEFLSTKAASLL
jgi:hypothetical protein